MRRTNRSGALALMVGMMMANPSCGGSSDSGEGISQARHTNRLIHEKSPYLLQHAHNPVDWFPWGAEALRKAREEDKPIFLSIGYSTCHWCHVMEHESFENERIAEFLNQHFVPIKVDREERPDLDNLYMTAVQAITGRGGWPMSVFLTPQLEPFFGGTYFPPDDRWGRPGFMSILTRIDSAWRTDRTSLLSSAERVTDFVRAQATGATSDRPDAMPTEKVLEQGYESLRQRFDETRGGFGDAPKFPTPHNLTFLLRYAKRTGSAEALRMVTRTLDAMAAGGIHDHLGGGFHRYSTDAEWLAPHFEKMLYDQAGLARAYTDAYLVTGDRLYAGVTRDILDYVLAYLTDPAGGFYSAEDADSEGEEGTFYVWTPEQIREVLGEDLAERFSRGFGVTAGGNWEGKSILHRAAWREPLLGELEDARRSLLEARDGRPRPHRDEKIIVAWNGYMIEAFARAGRALGETRYIEAARRAADFIEKDLWRDGRLLRYHHAGAAEALGYLDDYAYLGRGLLGLYEATFDARYLERAVHVAGEIHRLFARPEGGYTFSGNDGEKLLAEVVETYDGAFPSGNSAACVFMLRLGHLTANPEVKGRAETALKAFADPLTRSPAAHVEMLSAFDFALGPVTEVVVAGGARDPAVGELLQAIGERYLPNSVTAFHPAEDSGSIQALIPYLETQPALAGSATAYVCQNYACQLPVHERSALVKLLEP